MPFNHRLMRPKAAAVPAGPSYDSDAAAYIAAVESADGQSLETAVASAINDFVVGCKADGIWSAIKASCILCGARTLSGALTPLVGSAPTNNGPFVSGDYARGGATPGLKGNASTKYLSSGRADNVDGQNDCHRAVWVSTLNSANFQIYFGARSADFATMTEYFPYRFSIYTESARCRSAGGIGVETSPESAGFKGVSRSAAASFIARSNGATQTCTETSSSTSFSGAVQIFSTTGGVNKSDGRIAFYSIGSALTLTTLESRVSTLITAIGAAVS